MIIAHNMMAMNTHRQLGINGANSQKSIEKLSSGQRINRAGDDAAGLSISEKMRGQIRGLNQASRNAQDGISMVQTAEGALQETQAILQRMRELSVQASNDTNVDADRDAIQGEISQLKSEIDRIGDTTEFNKQSLLKGDGKSNLSGTSLSNVSGKLGETGFGTAGADAYKTQAINSTTIAAATSKIAADNTLKWTISGQTLTATFKANDASKGDAGEAFDVTATSASINRAGADGTDTYGATDSAKVATDTAAALQAMIDKNDTLKGAYVAKVSGSDVVIEAVKGERFDGAAGNISAVTSGLTTATATTKAADTKAGTDVAAVAATREINLDSLVDTSGADAAAKLSNTLDNIKSLVGKGMTINGQQVEFYNANDGSYKGDAIGINISDSLLGSTNETAVDKLVETIASQVSDSIDGVKLSQKGSSTGADAQILVIEASEAGKAGNNLEISDGGVQKEFKAEFQIGSNQGQTMSISIDDMRSDALGITDVDMSTKEGAQASVDSIDSALSKVSAQRSKLGAFQNRLEHSIKNLDASSENLQAAESRVRDVDMAKEMMNHTKNNILQQAAQAMLAQANQAPQGVLQLLR